MENTHELILMCVLSVNFKRSRLLRCLSDDPVAPRSCPLLHQLLEIGMCTLLSECVHESNFQPIDGFFFFSYTLSLEMSVSVVKGRTFGGSALCGRCLAEPSSSIAINLWVLPDRRRPIFEFYHQRLRLNSTCECFLR